MSLPPWRPAAALAALVIISGCAPSRSVTHPVARPSPVSASLAWLESPGGQAQVTLNEDVDSLASALYVESQAPTGANHVAFEGAARAVRAQARRILANRALLPAAGRARYEAMLRDFITVADLLQPGAGYGNASQDWAAWEQALRASDIEVS
jgi:hypothetical protein